MTVSNGDTEAEGMSIRFFSASSASLAYQDRSARPRFTSLVPNRFDAIDASRGPFGSQFGCVSVNVTMSVRLLLSGCTHQRTSIFGSHAS